MARRNLVALIGLVCASLQAEVRLPAIFSDGMVLQADKPARFFGKAEPNEAITITLAGRTVNAQAGPDGRWRASLPALPAGGPWECTISGTNRITIRDVLAGEVWLASGQSNMDWPLEKSERAAADIPTAQHPRIRFFQVKKATSTAPEEDISGTWESMTPLTAPKLSAVAYYFAVELQKHRKVPIAIVQSSWGGTAAQAWMRRETLEADARFHTYLLRYARLEEQARLTAKPVAPNARPTGLWNAMIAPLVGYSLRGFLWYQGEANRLGADAEQYRYLFPALIEDWRQQWAQGDLPFLFVQLAPFRAPKAADLPTVRESQSRTLRLVNTEMASTLDIGNANDIHPTNKHDVGLRLALLARSVAYGEKLVARGPRLLSVEREGIAVRLIFDQPLRNKSGALQPVKGFESATGDGVFQTGTARIEGRSIAIEGTTAGVIRSVRYAWVDVPTADLVNAEALPADPFRVAVP
jgi:sialate O-acetylesterase